jgi:glycyl-tRNA synthetase
MPAEAPPQKDYHEELMATLKRRGYLQPSYEIYGGVAGFYDYGPLGAALKTNLENLWRRFFVLQEGMAEIQCPTISPEQVFRASGHLEKFADTVIDCPECGTGNRGDHLVRNEWQRLLDEFAPILVKNGLADHAAALAREMESERESADRDPSPENLRRLLEQPGGTFHSDHGLLVQRTGRAVVISKNQKPLYEGHVRCPACLKPLDVQKARIDAFNLMFRTQVGPGTGRAGYLRPETAQGMFMDFTWISRYFRGQMPFGAVQLGKAYRNEISPRQSLLRLREFHQMEAEVFFDPKDKTWPRFAALADKELNLLAREESEPRRMRMTEAVEKGIIANGALGYFIALTAEFLETAGIPQATLRFRQHGVKEKAHYATDTWDAEFLSPRFGWVEIVGIADRTDYDLKAHERVSGQDVRQLRRFPEAREMEISRYVPNPAKLGPRYKGKAGAITKVLSEMEAPDVAPPTLKIEADGESFTLTSDCYRVEKRVERVEGEWYVPHVVEPSFGVDRIFYATLETAVYEKEWMTLRLAPQVAPVKCGVFPLMAKDGLDTIALDIDRELRMGGVASQYDDGGAIGRRYARQDEIGTPFCITVDYDSKADGTVTLRERDTGAQKRVPKDQLLGMLQALVSGRASFAEVDGTPVA